MDGTSEPLLPSSVDTEVLEQPLNVQSAIYRAPDKAVRYLTGDAAVRLGSFTVQDTTVRQMLNQNTVLTLGASSQNIDWKNIWQRKLDADDSFDASNDHNTAPMEVEAFVVNVRNAVHADDEGILNPLIKRQQAGLVAQRVFSSPAVKAVISFKWNTWASKFLYFELGLYLLWLTSFQAFCLLFQDEDTTKSLGELLHTRRGLASVILEGLALVGMVPFLWIELSTFCEYGPRIWLNTWNCLDCLTYAGQVLVTVMHLTRWHIQDDRTSVLVALQVLLLWLKVQYFARVLQPSEQPFMETLRSVINQVKWFLFLLLLTVWGFACAFYILFRKDQKQSDDFDTIWHSLLTMVGVMLGGPDLKIYYGSHNAGVCIALLLVYVFAMSLVLLNCLIGIMANACTRVSENNESVFNFSRAAIIDELEASLPAWFRNIWAGTWYPAYVHYLQVNTASADVNLLDELSVDAKAGDGDDGGDGQKAQGDLAARVAAMEAQLSRVAELQEAMAKSALGRAYTPPPSPGGGNGDGSGDVGISGRLSRMVLGK